MNAPIRPARIAIAGHTNVGKTTLLRTITRKQVGEIADRAGVTTQTHHELHTTLQAIFIDCPGFERAGLIWFLYLMQDQRLPSLEELQRIELIASSQKKAAEAEKDKENKDEKKGYRATAKAELDAVAALQQADAAIYVASVEYVPDTDFDHEIALVVTMQPNTVAVINKAREAESKKPDDNTEGRIAQWTETFTAAGVKHIVVLDAHWHAPARMTELYDALVDSLNGEARDGFRIGLGRFAEWRAGIRENAADAIMRSLCDLRNENARYTEKFLADPRDAEAVREAVRKSLERLVTKFRDEIEKIYGVACIAQYEAKSRSWESIQLSFKDAAKGAAWGGGIIAAVGAAVGGWGGGLVGAIGSIFVAGLDGGALTLSGATLGAEVGGAIGVAVGSALRVKTRVIDLYQSPEELEKYAAWALTVVCAESRHGYGLGPGLKAEKVPDLIEEVRVTMKNITPQPDFFNTPAVEMQQWFGKVLKSLEGI